MIEGLKIQDFSAGYAKHLIIKALDVEPLPKEGHRIVGAQMVAENQHYHKSIGWIK